MSSAEPVELPDALAGLRADYDSARRQLQADLKAVGATEEEAEVWLDALDGMHHAAASTLFRIENGARPKLTVN